MTFSESVAWLLSGGESVPEIIGEDQETVSGCSSVVSEQSENTDGRVAGKKSGSCWAGSSTVSNQSVTVE